MRVSTAAPKRTRPSLANSEGWIVSGPRLIQFVLPLTLLPSGVKTSSCRPMAPRSAGTPSDFHRETESLDTSSSAMAPTIANCICRRKIV